ncbi:hypothetical protein [Winogradskyella haliclonae]|uniref:Uncharacterized protein n=1 Tax=Winogradskyella haliclonae TaxID=2048558 RepID=A0ABQ2C245_9FLAO|nr:hypothetical protein [Winogradskyella haliclonae]GGI58449.1 hypothetical protein GCM10011444_27580 [Winogradskyella haliclonae]
MRGANYSNHYFGNLNNDNGVITFIAEKAIRVNSCKSGKYGKSIIGIDFGKDEKAFNDLKTFNVTYKDITGEVKRVEVDSLRNYINIPNQESVTIHLDSSEGEFFKSEKITLDPNTTMLCVSSRIRLDEYKFEIKDDKSLVAINYFGTSQTYTIK